MSEFEKAYAILAVVVLGSTFFDKGTPRYVMYGTFCVMLGLLLVCAAIRNSRRR